MNATIQKNDMDLSDLLYPTGSLEDDVYNGRLTAIQNKCVELIKRTGTVNNKDYLLHIACESGQFGSSALLIALGANIDAVNDQGDTPAIVAARCGSPDIIKLLADRGADLSYINPNTAENAALAAAKRGRLATLRKIEDAGFKIDSVDLGKSNVLDFALFKGDLNSVKKILDIAPEMAERVDHNGNTTLIKAAMLNCDKDIISELVSRGVDINARNQDGDNAVSCAVYNDNIEVLLSLVQLGARLGGVNKNGDSLVDISMKTQSRACHRVLIELTRMAAEGKGRGFVLK